MATKQKVLDLTRFGPVIDVEGCMDECFHHLQSLLVFLHTDPKDSERFIKPKLSQKCRVIKSRVVFYGNTPDRRQSGTTKTISELIKEYKSWNCSHGKFDPKEAKWQDDCRRENYVREGRQRAAWGGFVQTMSYLNALEKENKYQNDLSKAGNEDEREKIKKKKKEDDEKTPYVMYIG